MLQELLETRAKLSHALGGEEGKVYVDTSMRKPQPGGETNKSRSQYYYNVKMNAVKWHLPTTQKDGTKYSPTRMQTSLQSLWSVLSKYCCWKWQLIALKWGEKILTMLLDDSAITKNIYNHPEAIHTWSHAWFGRWSSQGGVGHAANKAKERPRQHKHS